MIRAVYSLSAAIALASNTFLFSLLLFPDPAPVQSYLWPKPSHHCHGHRTLQLSSDFKFKLPHEAPTRLTMGANRFRKRILKSRFQSPVPVEATLLAKQDRSQVESVSLDTIAIEIEEEDGKDAALGLDTDESYRLLIAIREDPESAFDILNEECQAMPTSMFPKTVQGVIRAKTVFGALHGMETLSQLVINTPDGRKEIPNAPIVIHDRPLFPHRGLLVDSARNYLSMASLYRTIDAMAMNKLNVLHWHLTDAPSFPIVLEDVPAGKTPTEFYHHHHRKRGTVTEHEDDGDGAEADRDLSAARPLSPRPEGAAALLGTESQSPLMPPPRTSESTLPLSQLSAKGSYGPTMVYTKQDISDLVKYAMNRGVRVIPELDMPGHAWSWSLAFPEITTCLDGYPTASRFSAEPPSGQLNPILPRTYQVLEAVYDQVMPLFDEEVYFHAGSDEVNINCWNTTQSITDFMAKHKSMRKRDQAGFDQILEMFISRQHDKLRSGGKVPIVWEEPLLEHDLKTIRENKDTIIQVWTSAKNIKAAVRMGHRVITGSADSWYLDCGFGGWLGNWTLGQSWCQYKSWQKIYSFNPILGLNSKEAKSVLGGEALLWGEQVDDTNLDSKLWPRAAAAAEVLWSGNSDDSKTKLWNGPDQEDDTLRNVEALARLNEHRFRMVAERINAEPLQPLRCAQNPLHCDWPLGDAKPDDAAY